MTNRMTREELTKMLAEYPWLWAIAQNWDRVSIQVEKIDSNTVGAQFASGDLWGMYDEFRGTPRVGILDKCETGCRRTVKQLKAVLSRLRDDPCMILAKSVRLNILAEGGPGPLDPVVYITVFKHGYLRVKYLAEDALRCIEKAGLLDEAPCQ